jgi:hypothetical protein
VKVELALLEAAIGEPAGYTDYEDIWDRARKDQPQEIAEYAASLFCEALTVEQRRILGSSTDLDATVRQLAANSDPSNLPLLLEHLRFHWAQ